MMDESRTMKWALEASPEDIYKELEKLKLAKEESMLELNDLLKQRTYVDDKIKGLSKVLPTLKMIKTEAENLVGTIKDISASSDKISGEIKTLDIARSRIEECQKRVSDLIDLELCAQGVQKAINDEDYETGAGHIHRFLSIDQTLLKRTATDEKAPGILKSVRTLQDAASQLRAIVKHRFDEAIRNVDLTAIERFFKIFPLLGMHDDGIHDFCIYLCTKLEDTARKNMKTALNTSVVDKRHPVIYADTLTLLFEGLARIIDTHHPLIETYYGPGKLLLAVSILQLECDKQCRVIMLEFNKNRQLHKKISAINDMITVSGSFSKLERIDPKDLDMLIGEMTIMHARAELYIKYIRRKVIGDLEIGVTDDDERKKKFVELDNLIKNSQLSQSKHELLGNYLRMEQYFMEESVAKAVNMDVLDTASEQKTSSLVDDCFFIIRKCIRRAISTGSLDGCCAVINTGCRVLESDYCIVLKNRLKQGYPSGYLDLTQAYNVLHSSIQQGRLQPGDAEQARTTFIIALNNTEVSIEYVDALCDRILQEIEQAMPNMTDNERGKLESCLSGLSAVTANLKDVTDFGMTQLRSSAVKPRVNPWVDAFLAVNHQFNEDELSVYEAGVPFVQTLIFNLDSLLSAFKEVLTPSNYDTLVSIITAEVTARLETVIFKTTFNRLGGLILDKEVRNLAGYLTTSTSWSVRDKFARLTQIATVLNLDKVAEISDYWGSHEGALTWRITPTELRSIMMLRTDFKIDEIRRLKL